MKSASKFFKIDSTNVNECFMFSFFEDVEFQFAHSLPCNLCISFSKFVQKNFVQKNFHSKKSKQIDKFLTKMIAK